MAAGPIQERNQDATIYVGGLDEKVTEALLWELFLQGGPVVNVHMPRDRITQLHQGYGFVEFMGEDDADYAIKIMNMIKLYGKPIRVNKAASNTKNLDVGANVFIGNLDPEIDEKLLYDTFSAFGVILQTPKIMRDPDTGNSKGFAFVNYASFDASDAAIEAMHGQHLCNRAITVSYAFKKDSKGERHGSAAERMLAAQNPLTQMDRPHQLFADAPPIQPQPAAPPQMPHPAFMPAMAPMPLMMAPMAQLHNMPQPMQFQPPPPPPPHSAPQMSPGMFPHPHGPPRPLMGGAPPLPHHLRQEAPQHMPRPLPGPQGEGAPRMFHPPGPPGAPPPHLRPPQHELPPPPHHHHQMGMPPPRGPPPHPPPLMPPRGMPPSHPHMGMPPPSHQPFGMPPPPPPPRGMAPPPPGPPGGYNPIPPPPQQ